MFMENNYINTLIKKLISLENLSFSEIKEGFDEIIQGLAGIIPTTSFISTLAAKKETVEELSGAILASREGIKRFSTNSFEINSIENIFFDFNSEYLNLPLALDLMVSAQELGVMRYHFKTPFSFDESFKILNLLGIDFSKFSESIDEIEDIFEKTKFFYLELGMNEPYFKYTNEIVRELPFKNILNITEKMLNPFGIKNQFIGVSEKNQVENFSNLALNLKNENTIVLSSQEGLPFVSIENTTYVAEAWKNKIFTYALSPDLLGFKENSIECLKCESSEENSEILLNIFNNKIKDSRKDFIVLNSALALYISKKAASIMDGIDLAKKTIEDGLVLEKINQLKSITKK